ncbi:MAG: cell division protein FtsW [Flavobacteriales bacterium]|nr:cell division protein FtsW [Flavobacteriales bacterium]|tara:strand:- start:76066 stop:77187 length:1122 start_codon:yes stop_codon:yes gene_type:complete
MNFFLKHIRFKGDPIIWIIATFFSLFSIMVVYSTAGFLDVINHSAKLVIGIIAMYVVHLIPFKYFSKIGQLGYYISLLLLFLVFLIGISVNGASRWIAIAGLQFQPSDIAKLTVILFLARQISIYRNKIKNLKDFLIHLLLPLFLVCVLILPNNFSTASLVFINGVVLMFLGGVKLNYITKLFLTSFLIALSIYLLNKHSSLGEKLIPRSSTWVSRVDSFFGDNNEVMGKDYQQVQALVAIQNGKIQGVGPGKSQQRGVLPYSESDFIFAILLEEYGLIGASVLILCYLILLFRAIKIYLRTDSIFGSLIVVGLIFSIIFQALVNMLVSVSIIPVTGQTLPLISMGGTSLVFTFISIGIVLSVSRDSLSGNYE